MFLKRLEMVDVAANNVTQILSNYFQFAAKKKKEKLFSQ